jgi:hypothetical protein
MAERRYWTNTFNAQTWTKRDPTRLHWSRDAHKRLTALEPGDLVFGYVTKVGWAAVYECTTAVRAASDESQWDEEYPVLAEVRELLVLGLDDALHVSELPTPDALLRQNDGTGHAKPFLYQQQGKLLSVEVGERLLAALVDRWQEHNPGRSVQLVGTSRPDVVSMVGAGRQPDAEVRCAVEQRAMAVVTAHFEALGYEVEDVSRQASYDLHLARGPETVRVEVKGSSGPADSVELTRNEVALAAAPGRSCLAVVDRIGWERLENGDVVARGGNLRVWDGWSPAAEDLEPVTYRYRLP